MTSGAVLELHPKQLALLWAKVEPHIEVITYGLEDDALCCWKLRPIKKKQVYTKKHAGVKKRRGPYTKAGYSFAGMYAQTTLNKKEHRSLDLPSTLFPTARTFQVTHLSLLRAGKRPPENDWQLYNASHLCGFGHCINPDHLIWERLDLNFARRMCHAFGAFEHCPHDPQCVHRAPFKHFKRPRKK